MLVLWRLSVLFSSVAVMQIMNIYELMQQMGRLLHSLTALAQCSALRIAQNQQRGFISPAQLDHNYD